MKPLTAALMKRPLCTSRCAFERRLIACTSLGSSSKGSSWGTSRCPGRARRTRASSNLGRSPGPTL
eukprot:10219359-Alexandrium_andersonii.AAC.1